MWLANGGRAALRRVRGKIRTRHILIAVGVALAAVLWWHSDTWHAPPPGHDRMATIRHVFTAVLLLCAAIVISPGPMLAMHPNTLQLRRVAGGLACLVGARRACHPLGSAYLAELRQALRVGSGRARCPWPTVPPVRQAQQTAVASVLLLWRVSALRRARLAPKVHDLLVSEGTRASAQEGSN